MRKLLAFLLLIPSIAAAEFLPDGCYVANFYRNDPCWFSNSPVYQWTAFDNQSTAVAFYGGPVATIIQSAANEQAAKNLCITQRNNAIAAYEAELARANNNYDVADYYETQFNKYNKYAKKLKKACGSKCKKIKP